ncbi:MAG: AgmX/PglI C-terminal domain-containing protein [Bdellovibrionaceae bacterium]|nr:AgmX/PglI C-terminal domain-containing protein [Pseudobdellovibrionaceae bacterium]
MKIALLAFCLLLLTSACTSAPSESASNSSEQTSGENVKTIDREGIRRTFFTHQKEIQHCYEKEVKKSNNSDSNLNGKLVLDFDIIDEGKITRAAYSAQKSTLHNEVLTSCITEQMKTWTFPSPPKGQTVQVFYPLAFSKK